MTIIAIVEEAFFEAQETKPIGNENTKIGALETTNSRNDPDHTDSVIPQELDPAINRLSDLSQNTSSKSAVIADESQSFASSLRGKRDLPDHLKYLLKNVDRSSNTANAATSGAIMGGGGNISGTDIG
jgi:hypothetical protein